MAPPGKHTAAEGGTFPDLSNDELGALWADTLRSFAIRRTGSSRDFWRKMLREDDILGILAEFRRRAIERQEEYEAWMDLAHRWRL